jgi:hypothetical protein
VVHRNWITRYGLPTHAEAGILRACYGLGETTAAEWSVIEGFIRPRDGKPPEAFYTVIGGDRIWIVVDGKGAPIDHAPFDSRMDAWRHIDRLRHAAGCGPAVHMPSPEVLSIPIWRMRPRGWSGDTEAGCLSETKDQGRRFKGKTCNFCQWLTLSGILYG